MRGSGLPTCSAPTCSTPTGSATRRGPTPPTRTSPTRSVARPPDRFWRRRTRVSWGLATPRPRFSEQQIGEAVVVPVAGAEPCLGSVRVADEQVQVVLPRVADAAVDLDAVLGRTRGGGAGRRLRHVCRPVPVG